MAKRTYGCSTVINAVCLQFELAGHGLFTSIHRAKGGTWLCEHAIKRVGFCDCNQGRLPCTCGRENTVTRPVSAFQKQWDAQKPALLQGRTWSDA